MDDTICSVLNAQGVTECKSHNSSVESTLSNMDTHLHVAHQDSNLFLWVYISCKPSHVI